MVNIRNLTRHAALLAGAATLIALLGAVAEPAAARVNVNVHLFAGGIPNLVLVPGTAVYYTDEPGYPVYRYHDCYYADEDGVWYRSYGDDEWAPVRYAYVP